jgi:hypothetical protein
MDTDKIAFLFGAGVSIPAKSPKLYTKYFME